MDNPYEQMIRIMRLLEQFYTPSQALEYMTSPHPLLNEQTPISVIERGMWEDVWRVLKMMEEGAYL